MKLKDYKYCAFRRIAAVVPKVELADIDRNLENIIDIVRNNNDSDIIVFPELSLTGYSIGDLVNQKIISDKVEEALQKLAVISASFKPVIAVGAPIRHRNRLFNCGILIYNGRIISITPKINIPNYSEYYEGRWFDSGKDVENEYINIGIFRNVPLGKWIITCIEDMKIGIEICEDLWVPIPPSSLLSMGGANIVLNLSASNHIIGKQAYRTALISQQSARCRCVYAYSSAGKGESSTDIVFPGFAAIAENGTIIGQTSPFPDTPTIVKADIDLDKIENDRLRYNTFSDPTLSTDFIFVSPDDSHEPPSQDDNETDICLLGKEIERYPFVPSDISHRDENCTEIISIQCHGLKQRLEAINCNKVIIGVSGGLDSTLALLLARRTFDLMGLSPEGITGITMPGLATTSKTHNNAWELMKLLKITALEIPIKKAVDQHFSDIGQDPDLHDAAFENSQARERTQILMDYANKVGGIVLGTGDLSELALGWCTYNGDHMSMYGINSSVPKTLVKHLVEWFAARTDNSKIKDVLVDIINTPISPELVPPSNGEDSIVQKTEDLVGPYKLHDFFLFHMLRHSFTPRKIFLLACEAFKEEYDKQTILKWLRNFYHRFFSQQFKRSCMPDGPKVGSVCLSPRGDWRMPSDASSSLWKRQLEEMEKELD